jgi:heme/copper-type cytochrome/quinol oxidase subunit 1
MDYCYIDELPHIPTTHDAKQRLRQHGRRADWLARQLVCCVLGLTHFLSVRSEISQQTATRAFASDLSPGENVIVPLIANSLEWALSSPPPLHQFTEPPLVVETDHLDLNPGKEVEEILAAQGHEVTDIVGKEKWVLNDPALYEGLIPQNEEWTEFVDEKTGEFVTLDEYGQKVST